jgi:hypothetical protein
LLERIGIKESDKSTTIYETKDLAESPTLLSPERLLLMQSTPYSADTLRVETNLRQGGTRHNVIAANGGVWSQYLATPTVYQRQHRKGQRRPHKASPLHRDAYNVAALADRTARQVTHLLPVSFGEVTTTVLNIVPPVTDPKGIGSDLAPGRAKPGASHSAKYGFNGTMSKTVSGFCQVGTKIVLTTARERGKSANVLIRVNATQEVADTFVFLSQYAKHGFPTKRSRSKDTGRRDGNDTHLAALLRDRSCSVDKAAKLVPGGAEVLHRQQGTITLQNFRVLLLLERTSSHYFEQSVKKTILSGKGCDTTRCRQDSLLHLTPEHVPTEVMFNQHQKVLVVSPFTTRYFSNSVLAARCMSPSTISQRISEPFRHTVLQTLTDSIRNSVRFRNVGCMVQQALGDGRPRRLWQRTGTPCKGKGATRVRHRELSEPSPQGPGYSNPRFWLAIREDKITEGRAKVLYLLAYPVRTTGSTVEDPPTEHPATMLLRNTTGYETTPYSLPDGCMGIDLTSPGRTGSRV